MQELGDLLPSPVQPAIYAYKHRHFIQEHWKKLQIAMGIGKPNIVVTGRAGVGKSVLVSHYHGEANKLDWKNPESSPDVEIKPIPVGEWTKIVHVVPGQHGKERSVALDNALNQHNALEGIIHVVDWGFTSIRDDVVKEELLNRGVDTIEKLRQVNLQHEIDDLKLMMDRIAISISSGRGPKWLIIAINKIDLFEDSIESATKYYDPRHGDSFGKEISSLLRIVGENNLKVCCIPVCASPEPYSWGSEVSKSQIDSIMKYKGYLKRFVDSVALIQKSTER